jgi:hypothetical protein
MLRWIARFVLFRVLGGRALAALAVVGFIRRLLAGRRASITRTGSTQPRSSPPSGSTTNGSTSRSGSSSSSGSSSGR